MDFGPSANVETISSIAGEFTDGTDIQTAW
jgi:hypothetical protein